MWINALKEYEADRQNKDNFKACKDALDEYQKVSAKVIGNRTFKEIIQYTRKTS